MKNSYDFVLKNGQVIDPINKINAIKDIGIRTGRISDIASEISPDKAKKYLDLKGALVLPGIIDLHVHASSWLGGKFAHKMMAEAGVTTALDMSGPIESVLNIAAKHGVGLNLASIQYVRPGHTVKNANPGRSELEELLFRSLQKGAIGFKILGGHYPLTLEATALAIEIAVANQAYVALHAGSIKTKSNIEGFLEAVGLAQGNPVHLAHINSYCRGNVRPYIQETEEAISVLSENHHICSEAYLSPVNGTSAKCCNGLPESEITAMCLTAGGFEASTEGLEAAIVAGWAQINMESRDCVTLASGKIAVDYWCEKGTDVTVSFQVNPIEPRLRLTTARRASGDFVVDCISTDGGGIPRNVTVEMGLSLVRLQAMSIEDFVIKTSINPAKILGLTGKGHLGIGADADITVVEKFTQKPLMTMVDGKMIMYQGNVFGSGSNIITTSYGEASVRAYGLTPIVIDPTVTRFCQR